MASEGKNEVARSLLDLQPTAILELYKLYPDTVNSPSTYLSFHGGSVFGGNVVWQGIQYIPIPVEADGFGVFSDGSLPRPTLKVANNEKIVTYFLSKYQDFKNAKVYRKKVFLKHLDDSNFDGQNPFGLANSESEISEEKYLIGQKKQENKSFVEFELNLPLDLDNFDVNHRTVNAKYCYWQYRGMGCQYQGKPIEKDNGEAFLTPSGSRVSLNVNDEFLSEQSHYQTDKSYSVGNAVYVENKNVIVGRNYDNSPIYHKAVYVCVADNTGKPVEDNPSYWQKDGCTKKIEACQKRFSAGSLKKIFVGSSSDTFKYLHNISDNAVSFRTEDSSVKTAFGTSAWTLSLYIRASERQYLDSSNDQWYSPIIMSTHELPTSNDKLNIQNDGANYLAAKIRAALYFATQNDSSNNNGRTINITSCPDTSETKSRLKNAIRPLIDFGENESKFSFVVLRLNEDGTKIEVLLNPFRGESGVLETQNDSLVRPINTSDLDADFFSVFGDKKTNIDTKQSFAGDIGQACLWSKRLTDDEIIWATTSNAISDSEYYLTDNNLQKRTDFYPDYVPLSYSDATGYRSTLRNNLVFWYDMTGLDSDGGASYIADESPNNIRLTGYSSNNDIQNVSVRTVEYTKAEFEDFIPNQNSESVLPFGGFPGTDGYDYKAGPQSI